MKKGYKIISNGEQYKVQRFYSFLGATFSLTKTCDGLHRRYLDAKRRIDWLKEERESIEKAKKRRREMRKKSWSVIKIFFD